MKSRVYAILLLTILTLGSIKCAQAGEYNVTLSPVFKGAAPEIQSCNNTEEICVLSMTIPEQKKPAAMMRKETMYVVMWFWEDRVIYFFLRGHEYEGWTYMSIYRDGQGDYYFMDTGNSRRLRNILSQYKPDLSQKIPLASDGIGVILPGDFIDNVDIRLTKTGE